MSNTQIPPLQLDDEDPRTASALPRTDADNRTRTVQASADSAKIVRTREAPSPVLRFGVVIGLMNGPDQTVYDRFDAEIRNRYLAAVTHCGDASPPPASAVSIAWATPRAADDAQDRPCQSVLWGGDKPSSRRAGVAARRVPGACGADVIRFETSPSDVHEAAAGR